jgi:hypothetical protein
MSLPHITNSQAGVNKWDPVHTNIFEVYFSLPEALRTSFGKDEALLTEHVLSIDGLGALNRAPGVSQQKFMGTDRSYIKPTIGETRANLEVKFSLNLRNGTDNYILKLFRAWAALGYDIKTGKRSLKKDYCAQWMKVSIANREGDIYQEVVFKDVMMNGSVDFDGSLEYTADDALELTVKFVSDWWDELEA